MVDYPTTCNVSNPIHREYTWHTCKLTATSAMCAVTSPHCGLWFYCQHVL